MNQIIKFNIQSIIILNLYELIRPNVAPFFFFFLHIFKNQKKIQKKK